MSDDVPTIFQWAGAEVAFARWLNAFYHPGEQEPEFARRFG